MTRRIISVPLLFVTGLTLYAQNSWTPQDSIHLKRILSGTEELKLNPEAIKIIDFGSVGTPMHSSEKPWMLPDETLPTTLPDEQEKKKVVLTLFPYNAQTKFNWDPVYRKKIKVTENTWRNDPFAHFGNLFIYGNWAKRPMDGGVRKSLEEIEATGIRYNVFGERANNMAVGRWVPANGGPINNLDLMTPFTKDFWDVKGRSRRNRTLEVLGSYGDSTTTVLPDALPKVVAH